MHLHCTSSMRGQPPPVCGRFSCSRADRIGKVHRGGPAPSRSRVSHLVLPSQLSHSSVRSAVALPICPCLSGQAVHASLE